APWSNITPIASLANTTARSCAISSDGLRLYAVNGSPNALGQVVVLARASRADPFGPPFLLPELSAFTDVSDVEVTPDGRIMYVSRGRNVYASCLIPVLPHQVASDFDGDGDVDAVDFSHLQLCY